MQVEVSSADLLVPQSSQERSKNGQHSGQAAGGKREAMSADTGRSRDGLDWLVVDESSAAAPYEQIRRQIAEAVHSGKLVPGAKLPAVRALASRLGLAVNTVARSYRELEQAELVQTRSRAGTTVAPGTDQGRRRLAQAAAVYADVARNQGASAGEAIAFLKAAMDAADYGG